MADDRSGPERPYTEPEIIPPSRPRDRFDSRRTMWDTSPHPYESNETRGSYRVHVTRVGPLGIALWLLVLAAIAALAFFTILGIALIWIPIIALAVAVGAVYRLLRR